MTMTKTMAKTRAKTKAKKDIDKDRDIEISESYTRPMEKIKGSTFTLRKKIKQEPILIFILNGLYLMIPFVLIIEHIITDYM